MANIDGLAGYNSPTGLNKLIAAYGNDLIDLGTGLGYSQNITAGNKWDFEVFIDRLFACNGADANRSLGNNNKWSTNISQPKQLKSKYVKDYKSQLFLGNCILTPGGGDPISYRSRVFRSKFPSIIAGPAGTYLQYDIQWGLESGTCTITPGSDVVHAIKDGNGKLPYFLSRGIQVGDPFFLLEGDVGEYTVIEIINEYTLRLDRVPPNLPSGTLNTNVLFWVGRNWFDVGTDDNDEITAFGENADRLLISKLYSLWFYNGSQEKQIKGPGTSSFRSMINDKRTGDTYFFHGSDPKLTGIYKVMGNNSILISRAIDPFIRGMDSANYDDVVAWQEGNELRFFLGDLTNRNYGVSITKAVATLNIDNQTFDVGPIADNVRCATSFKTNNLESAYVGTDDDEVQKMDTGNDFNGSPIPASLVTKVYYPAGSEVINDFLYIQVIARSGRGTRVKYKLWNQPEDADDVWWSLGELRGDKTEFVVDKKHMSAAGIQFRFDNMGIVEKDTYVEKVSIFYKPGRVRMV